MPLIKFNTVDIDLNQDQNSWDGRCPCCDHHITIHSNERVMDSYSFHCEFCGQKQGETPCPHCDTMIEFRISGTTNTRHGGLVTMHCHHCDYQRNDRH